jgi:glycosyltransferase involved in cell wall biosynthesis
MKLLIVTQTVDKRDDVLGFFHRWLQEFSTYFESIIVICLKKGEVDLPNNIKVISLGKEQGASRLTYIFRFYKYIFKYKKDYHTVFVHMNPVYVVLGGIFWKLMGKKIALWYTHRQVDLKLRLAVPFTDVIFSAAPESFRIKTNKLKIVGHGIDTELFVFKNKIQDAIFTIVHVGRITRIKNCDTLIEAVAILKHKLQTPFKIIFIGKAVQIDDLSYEQELKKLIKDQNVEDVVEFKGSVPNIEMPHEYEKADVTVNLTPTGGLDKAVFESFATGTPVLITNEAFAGFLGEYKDRLQVIYRNPEDLAQKIADMYHAQYKEKIADYFSTKVKQEYSVPAIVGKLATGINRLI